MLFIFNLSGSYVELKTEVIGPLTGQKSLSLLQHFVRRIFYIFCRPLVPANELSVRSATWKTTEWQSKGITLWVYELCKQGMDANPIVWVTLVDPQ